MPRSQFQHPSRLTAVAGVALRVALGMLLLQDSAIAEVNLTAEATTGYTNNLLRTPNGESDVPVSLGLTGAWTEDTNHLSARVRGRVDGNKYLRDTYDEEVLGQLNASVTWWPAPEQFALVLVNVYGQIATDPFSPIGPANRQNSNYLSAGPDWYIPIGERTRAYLGGRFGSVRYEDTAENNSERLRGLVGVDRAIWATSRLGVQASTEAVTYDSPLQSDLDRNEAYIRYELARESQPELTINAGYTWLSSDVDDRSAPFLQVQLSRQVSGSVNLQLELVSQFSDAGQAFAAGEDPGFEDGMDPAVIPAGGVFEERGGRGAVAFEKSRSTLTFAIGMFDELYESAALDRRRYTAELHAERRITLHTTGLAGVSWSRDDYESDGLVREDTDTEYRLGIRRQLGRRSSFAVVGLYSSRSSDDPIVEYDETRGYVVFSYSLH